MKTCTRCIYDQKVPNISFNERGVCNYCLQVEALIEEFGTGSEKGESKLRKIIGQIKKSGKGKRYDCIIGVSGGTDSSYLLLKAKEWGLRPLAVHYDNTWNSAVSTMNIDRVTSVLDVDLFTHVVNNKEIDDIKKAFLLAGVAEFDAILQVLRSAAAKHRVSYILEGHSFVAEGISPIGGNYLDGGYVANVHDRFGSLKRETFPNLTFFQFLKWVLIYQQKFIRPLWYMRYSKEEARAELISKTGWEYYGGHHLENRASTFAHTVWLPQRFGIDYRNLTLSADVRRGAKGRDQAITEYSQPVKADTQLVEYLKKRLNISDDQYDEIMEGKVRTWRDFKTYKKRFEVMRPIFYILAKANLVPMSFYLKYCFPVKESA